MSKLEEEKLLLFCTGNKPSLYPYRNQKDRNKLGSSSAATPQNTLENKASLIAQLVKNPPAMQKIPVR